MAEYLATDSDMTKVADAIRAKGGTTEALTWPDGYKTAIDAIQTGGTPSLQSKSVTYTSNGTATITPDAGYDGLSSVNVTVNVSGGGGVEEVDISFIKAINNSSYNGKMFLVGEFGSFQCDFASIDNYNFELSNPTPINELFEDFYVMLSAPTDTPMRFRFYLSKDETTGQYSLTLMIMGL